MSAANKSANTTPSASTDGAELYAGLFAVLDDLEGLRAQQEQLLILIGAAVYDVEEPDEADPEGTQKAIRKLYTLTRALRVELGTLDDLGTRMRPAINFLHALKYGAKQ